MDVLSVFRNTGRDALTMAEFLQSSESLEAQAREAAPWKADRCTFDQGHVRQPVFSCLTCKESSGQPAGICATCSITCHSEHEQVELFSRRNFQCDCGTTRLGDEAICTMGKRLGQPPNDGNKYDSCFDNIFCICGRPYDPQTEEDEMLQCIVCENWLHSKCILPARQSQDKESEEGLALELDDFDSLVCADCAVKSATSAIWSKYAGHNGVMLVDDAGQTYGRLPAEELLPPAEDDANDAASSSKKHTLPSDESEEPPAKKVKTSEGSEDTTANSTEGGQASESRASTTCTAPERSLDIFEQLSQNKSRYAASLFLQEGWRSRFCRCEKCLELLKPYPYLLEEEEEVDLAEDDEPGTWTFLFDKTYCIVLTGWPTVKSIAEIADQHLNNLPRAQAAEVSSRIVELRESFLKFVNGLPANEDGSDVTVDQSMVQGWMQQLIARQQGQR